MRFDLPQKSSPLDGLLQGGEKAVLAAIQQNNAFSITCAVSLSQYLSAANNLAMTSISGHRIGVNVE